jgi:hypothetical protein
MFGMLLDKLRDPPHNLSACTRGRLWPRPIFESSESGFNRYVYIDLVAFRKQRPRLSGIWVESLEGLPRGGVGPPTIDIDSF